MKINKEKQRLLDALRFLRSLRHGDEVLVSIDGEHRKMFIAKVLDLSNDRAGILPSLVWELSNLHLTYGPGLPMISITVSQQSQANKELPFIVSKVRENIVRVIRLDSELYKRIDELAGTSAQRRQLASSIKNMVSKRAYQVPEKELVS